MKIGLILQPLKQYVFYLVLGAIVLGEVFFALGILPGWVNGIGDDRSNLETVTSEVTELTKTLNYLTQIDKPTLASLLVKANAALPDEKKTSGLVSGLSKLASSSGALIKTLEFSPGLISTSSAIPTIPPAASEQVIKDGGIKTLPAIMTVQADFNSLIFFLQKLDKASQLLGVSGLKYTANASEGNQTNIGLYIYYQPPEVSTVLWKQSTPLTLQEQKSLDDLSSQDIFTLQ